MTTPKKKSPYPTGQDFGRPKKYTTEMIKGEAEELIEWSNLKDSLILKEFCYYKPYTYKRMLEWEVNDPYFTEACLKARERIASNRERLALKNEINVPMVLRHLGIYDREYDYFRKKELEFEAKLKEKISDKADVLLDAMMKAMKKK